MLPVRPAQQVPGGRWVGSTWQAVGLRAAPARGPGVFGKYMMPHPQASAAHAPRSHSSAVLPQQSSTASMAASVVMDEAIMNTVAMLPPSPTNSLLEFLEGVVSGEIEPAMCHAEVRIDAPRYWEMRRVQNSIRRVLEALQDILGFDADVTASELGQVTWDGMFAAFANANGALDDVGFISALEAFGAWPPEMSNADRVEVFAALRVPCSAAVRALNTGQPMPKELTRRMLCEGLARVPFNIPDFPVPTHLLRSPAESSAVLEVAGAIAAAFCMDQTGLDRVKDFFLCGLLSLEQIQVVLPFFVTDSLIEQAVVKIVKAGAERFTAREWQTLVVSARVGPSPQPEVVDDVLPEAQAHAQAQLQLQAQAHAQAQAQAHAQAQAQALAQAQEAEVQAHTQALGQTPLQGLSHLPTPHQEATHESFSAAVSPTPAFRHVSQFRPAHDAFMADAAPSYAPMDDENLRPQRHSAPAVGIAMTEPLPHRAVQAAEEPVKFEEHWLGGGTSRIINWSTTRWHFEMGHSGTGSAPCLSGDPGHQADEGAGTRALALQHEQATPGVAGLFNRDADCSDDPVRLISLGMHNECLGPFLAQAFVRCCQLYEPRLEEVQVG